MWPAPLASHAPSDFSALVPIWARLREEGREARARIAPAELSRPCIRAPLGSLSRFCFAVLRRSDARAPQFVRAQGPDLTTEDNMNKEQAEKLSKDALDQLATELESGRSKRLSDYLATMARFPNYSFGNVILIANQRPDAPFVAGFNAWKKLGRFVKKGEKGIGIVAPSVGRKDTENDGSPVKGFRIVHVFAYESTDGQPLPGLAKIGGDPGDATAKLRRLIEAKGIE